MRLIGINPIPLPVKCAKSPFVVRLTREIIAAMDNEDEEFLSSITPEVMRALQSHGLMQHLSDLLSPKDASQTRETCDGTFRLSERLLRSAGFNDEDLHDISFVLKAQGAACDCEVLYNVSEANRLKAAYWKRRAGEHTNR